MTNWVRYHPPPPFSEPFPLESMRSGGSIPPPPSRGISAILARYHMKTRQTGTIPRLQYYLESCENTANRYDTPSAILSRNFESFEIVSQTGGGFYVFLSCRGPSLSQTEASMQVLQLPRRSSGGETLLRLAARRMTARMGQCMKRQAGVGPLVAASEAEVVEL